MYKVVCIKCKNNLRDNIAYLVQVLLTPMCYPGNTTTVKKMFFFQHFKKVDVQLEILPKLTQNANGFYTFIIAHIQTEINGLMQTPNLFRQLDKRNP